MHFIIRSCRSCGKIRFPPSLIVCYLYWRPVPLSALAERQFYEEGKPFTCLDGSRTIPFDRVNDDYCDCHDGSDEPGVCSVQCSREKFACSKQTSPLIWFARSLQEPLRAPMATSTARTLVSGPCSSLPPASMMGYAVGPWICVSLLAVCRLSRIYSDVCVSICRLLWHNGRIQQRRYVSEHVQVATCFVLDTGSVHFTFYFELLSSQVPLSIWLGRFQGAWSSREGEHAEDLGDHKGRFPPEAAAHPGGQERHRR